MSVWAKANLGELNLDEGKVRSAVSAHSVATFPRLIRATVAQVMEAVLEQSLDK